MVEIQQRDQFDLLNSVKNDFIYLNQKSDVCIGLYEQYLDQSLDDYKIHEENRDYLLSIFEEYQEIKKQIEETVYSPQNDEDSLSIKAQNMNLEEKKSITQEIIKSEVELKDLEDKGVRVKESKDSKKKLKAEEHKNKILAIQTENIMNKYKMFAKIDINQTSLIKSLISSHDGNSKNNVTLSKYYMHEILTGIQTTERLPFENRDMFEQFNTEKPWYDILFTQLPDECLDFDTNLENYPAQLKNNLLHLSNPLVEFYKSIFRKRKSTSCELSQKINNCVFLNNLDDFKTICTSYIPLICMTLTDKDLNDAMKQYAIEWVKGTRVVNILLNSSSSKMATVLLPQFYPLTSPNHIKLISLIDYEDKDIKNFRIEENLSSFAEWVTVFTEMYNNKSIV